MGREICHAHVTAVAIEAVQFSDSETTLIALGPDGAPQISYYRSGSRIARQTTLGWEARALTGYPNRVAFVVDAQGFAHLLSDVSYSSRFGCFDEIAYSYEDGSGPHTITIDNTSGAYALAVDPVGQTHFTYDSQYAVWDGQALSTGDLPISGMSLVLGPDGTVHLASAEPASSDTYPLPRHPTYARKTPEGWAVEVLGGGAVSRATFLVLMEFVVEGWLCVMALSPGATASPARPARWPTPVGIT